MAGDIDIQRPLNTSKAGGDAVGVLPLNAATTFTYIARNVGDATLTLGNKAVHITNKVGCDVEYTDTPSPVPLEPDETFNFNVYITPTEAEFSFDVSVDSDDEDEDPFEFTVSGTSGPGSDSGRSEGQQSRFCTRRRMATAKRF